MILISVLLGAASTPLQASTWEPIFDGAGSKGALDTSSIVGTDRYREAWTRLTLRTPDKNGVTKIVQLIQVDCRMREFAVRSHISYTKDGSVFDSNSVSGETDVPGSPVAPDTYAFNVYTRLCRLPPIN